MQILDSLGINATAVIWHLVNFLVLIVVLQRFLYRPVLRMLDERSRRIRESIEQAEATRAETERLQTESRGILDDARRQSQQLLAQSNRNAERILAEARQQAQEEAERLRQRAEADLVREREQMFQELRQEVADLAVSAAEQVIRRSLDGAAQRELVREFLAKQPAGREN